MLRTDLRTFFEPRSAVILGASPRSGVAHMFAQGLSPIARLAGTHPTNRELGSVPVVPSIADLDFRPDIACVALGPANAAAGIEEALAGGIRHFVVPGLGPETGAAGAEARARIGELCLAHGAAMVGPNCMGLVVAGRPSPWIGSILDSLRPGRVATVVESGSVGEALVAAGPRFGLRAIVSSGNELATDAADWLAYFAAEPETGAIGLMLETVRRPAEFEQALGLAAEAGRPVIVVKTGTSVVGAERAVAHSGAIAGSDAAFDAVLRGYGAVRCDDLGDWFEALEVFGTGRRPPGPRMVVITNSGGEGEHAADLAERAGIPLPALPADLAARLDADWPFHGAANPLDYYAVGEQAEILPAIARACASHRDIDGVVLNIDQSTRFVDSEAETSRLVAELAPAVVAETDAFVAVLSTSTADAPDHVLHACAGAGVPVLKSHGPGIRALAAAVRWRPRVPERPATPAAGAVPDRGGALPEADSKAFLAAYGIACPDERRAADPAAAVAAAVAIGFPVVVKADGPAHKERVGGVHLGCTSDHAVRRAAEACGGRVLVASELRGGVEVLAGMVRDPQFGPTVVVGVGGAWAEAVRESARTALAPLSQVEAEELVRLVAPLARRLDEAGVAAVGRVLVALGAAADHHPRIREIDVNPIRVHAGEAIALDALLVLEDP